MQWLEISQIAFNYLNQRQQVAFITEKEVFQQPQVVDLIRRDGFVPVVVSDAHKEKIDHQITSGGPVLRTVETYVRDFNASFQYKFVEPGQFTPFERKLFDLNGKIAEIIGISPASMPPVKISETMRLTVDNTDGVWDSQIKTIVILRRQLAKPEAYAGTLLHELLHATSSLSDVSREFEISLTNALGKAAIAVIRRSGML